MKYVLVSLFFTISLTACSQVDSEKKTDNMNKNSFYNILTPKEEEVIIYKGTETPFTGELYSVHEAGTYLCKRCNAPLYHSEDKFDAQCGWPSFDDEIDGAVARHLDSDGRRTEILCSNCGAHLGHVFLGEGFTEKNTRHCVNSVSMTFVAKGEDLPQKLEVALFASGCFWGTEYHLQRLKGVVATDVGYTGGKTDSPTYKQVCSGLTGHAETVRVLFDPSQVSYEELAKLFFETHDQSQVDRQGPDVGTQYRSAIFYLSERQKTIAEQLIAQLRLKGYSVATEVTKATVFWPAEKYHQDYYRNNGNSPYCHIYRKKF
jgi:peptide methionine sulfoxide reductase msrA/msrB